MKICNARFPDPSPNVLLFCGEEAGHKTNHRAAIITKGQYVEWPVEHVVEHDTPKPTHKDPIPTKKEDEKADEHQSKTDGNS